MDFASSFLQRIDSYPLENHMSGRPHLQFDCVILITMEIRLRYFASLREITGRNEETLTVPEETRVKEIRDLLQTRYPALQSVIERCINAVNRSYVSAETVLHEHDEIVFIPPMGGG
jgi:molybdopterin synthase sulfur carrier subunit